MLPGELFGYRRRDGDPYLLRGNFAVDVAQIQRFVARLTDFASVMRRRGPEIERHAHARARHAADVDAIVERLRR